MKALAIDSSSQFLTVYAQNDNLTCSMTLDIGVKQVEYILSMIENVLNEIALKPQDLQFTALCTGPGSFTGLRLGFAALKAIQTSFKVPVFGIPTLEALAQDFLWYEGMVIPCLDARRNRFYVSLFEYNKQIEGPLDIDANQIYEKIKDKKNVLLVGSGAELLKTQLKELNEKLSVNCISNSHNSGKSLIYLASKKFENNEKTIESYEGPYYIRDEHGNS